MENKKIGDFDINKIYCMDCLEGLNKIPNEAIDLIIIDPPYPIDRDNGTGRFLVDHPQEKEWFREGYNNWDNFLENFLNESKRVLKKDRHFYIFVNEENLVNIKTQCDKIFTFKSILIWLKATTPKESYGMGYHYRKSCEFVLLYTNGGSFRHIVDHGTLLHYPRNNYDIDHPTPKPVKMLKLFIEKSSNRGDTVLDFFSGSGSTLLACKQIDHNFIGFEIDPKYVTLSERRLEQQTIKDYII